MTAETDIAAIDDGGANTAAEVRTALTSVLARTADTVTPTPDASDEFDDASWGGTTVEDASPTTTVVERNGILAVKHPGGDAAAEVHGYVIPFSPAGDFVVMTKAKAAAVATGFTSPQMYGVMAADGNTYGAGNQIATLLELQANRVDIRRLTNYSAQAAIDTGDVVGEVWNVPFHLALQYTSSSNLWKSYWSPDGETWFSMTTAAELTSAAITTTHVGVCVTTWGSAVPFASSFEHIRAYDGTLAANGFSVI